VNGVDFCIPKYLPLFSIADTIQVEGPLANRSTLLSTFICILYIPCCGCFPVFSTIIPLFISLPDRDDNVHLIGGTEGGGRGKADRIAFHFVTMLILLRYHFIFLSFFFSFLGFFLFSFSLLFLCGGPASFMNHIYINIDKVGQVTMALRGANTSFYPVAL
jgi:hypothetical protein